MKYKQYDDFVICPIPEDAWLDMEQINKIVEYTHNTWQADRPKSEIRENTIQGKRAELVIEQLLKENSCARFIAYDNFRNDGFKKHAPFDGIIYMADIKQALLEEAIDKIKEDVKNSPGDSGTMRIETRAYLERLGVYTVEIKSSLLQDPRDYRQMAHKEADARTEQDYLALCRYIKGFYDYFVYPRFCRDSLAITSFYDYTVFVRDYYREQFSLPVRNFLYELMKNEFDNDCNIYTRVFFDVISNEIIIPGYVLKTRFFEEPRIQKMPSPKSSHAIYYMYHMEYGTSMLDIDGDDELWHWNSRAAYSRLFCAYQPLCPVCGNRLRITEAVRSAETGQHKFLYVCDSCKVGKKWLEMHKIHAKNMRSR